MKPTRATPVFATSNPTPAPPPPDPLGGSKSSRRSFANFAFKMPIWCYSGSWEQPHNQWTECLPSSPCSFAFVPIHLRYPWFFARYSWLVICDLQIEKENFFCALPWPFWLLTRSDGSFGGAVQWIFSYQLHGCWWFMDANLSLIFIGCFRYRPRRAFLVMPQEI